MNKVSECLVNIVFKTMDFASVNLGMGLDPEISNI